MKALFLDLDGTLINSEREFSRCFVDILNNDYHANVTLDDYRKYELEMDGKLISYVKKARMIDDGIDDNEIITRVRDSYEPYFRNVIKEEEAVDNFRLLREIKKLYALGLITTCKRKFLDILDTQEDIYRLFDIVVAREDVDALKPNPEAYLKALDKLGLDPIDVVAIEDSKRGVESSIAAGIKTIKVDNFTDKKFDDQRTIQEESANKVLRKIIEYK